jgi:TldD protein
MPVQAGWERIVDTPVVELFQREMDRVDALPPPPPVKPLDIGRYDVVLGVDAMLQLVSQTFGTATQVDRALGYWANSEGTSYLGPDPLTVLGTPVASPVVNLTAERSHPLGLATVKWDDEGVAPEDVALIKNGTLIDYQTTREQAPWLAPWYEKQGRPVRSHGHATAPSALEEPLQHTPNLVLHPGNGAATEESLLQELGRGVYIPSLNALEMDWQSLNGFAVLPHEAALEIRHGKPVSIVQGRALVFNTKELWKNVEMLGGTASAAYGYVITRKGDPVQQMQHSVCAVPMLIKQLAIIDPSRRA